MRKRLLQPPFLFPLVAVGVMALALALFFGRSHDRAMLSLFLRTVMDAPHLLERGGGEGRANWQVLSFAPVAVDSEWQQADDGRRNRQDSFVMLQDNLEGVFQGSPHSPVDFALIFRNLRRMGCESVAVGAVLAWEAPDAIGMVAVDRELGEFNRVVTTVPLARGATSESMPAAFRRASLPISAVAGDVSALPSVNRQAIPGVLLGGENALAGFTFAEPLVDEDAPLLMARWGDQVVFSFAFLAALQTAGLEVENLQIRLGSYIRSTADGWIIPIDARGNLAVEVGRAHDWRETPAEWLIDADPEVLPSATKPDFWLLRDDRSALETPFREQSEHLVPRVQAMARGVARVETQVIRGVSHWQAALLMIAVVALLAALGRLGWGAMHAGMALAFTGLLLLQWSALAFASLWMPAMPALLAINAAWVLVFLRENNFSPRRGARWITRTVKGLRAGTNRRY